MKGMKKRNLLFTVLIVAILASAIVFAACDDKKQTYTVKFEGDCVTPFEQVVKSGETAVKPQNPKREGYAFSGWKISGTDTYFDFSTPITSDLTLVAQWNTASGELGSEGNPYLINSANDLVDFAKKINNPDEEGNENYYKSFYRLDSDIDMSGVDFKTPIGKVVTLNEGEENESTILGFQGDFNGNGHKITNLNLTMNARNSIINAGLFGYTHRAHIYDLTLKDINYVVEAYSDDSKVGANIGGLVGAANLTNITGVKVSGTIETHMMSKNGVSIGGIVGGIAVSDSEQAYIAVIQGCETEVKTVMGKFDDDEPSNLDSAINGGILGFYSTQSNGALAIVNCVSNGKVNGGKYVGGIAGYLGSSRATIVNCANYSSVTATCKEGSYAGGIVGASGYNNDNTVMDSFSVGRIVGVKSTSASEKNETGQIAGHYSEDEYGIGYYPGLAVINSYYGGTISKFDKLTLLGTEISKDAITAAWIENTLKWDANAWNVNDGVVSPKRVTSAEKTYKISLYKEGSFVKDVEKTSSQYGFSTIGQIEALKNEGSNLFYDWYQAPDVRYRYYVPVVKDMRLDAKFGDATKVAAVYAGTYKKADETISSGVIALKADGTLSWVKGNAVGGTYTYDGEGRMIFNIFSGVGEVYAVIGQDGSFKMDVDAGITGTISHTFVKSNIRVYGEYYSDNGDLLTFSDGEVLMQSDSLKDGESVRGTYTLNGDDLSFAGDITDYYSSMSATLVGDDAIEVTFIGKSESIPSFSNVKFGRPVTDYREKPFLGSYIMTSISLSGSEYLPYQDKYTLNFKDDGSMTIRHGSFAPENGSYFSFSGDTFIKVNVSGNVSKLYYDKENNVFYGRWYTGTTSRTYTVMTPEADGEQRVFVFGENIKYIEDNASNSRVDKGIKNFITVTENGKFYYVNDGVLMKDSNVEVKNAFSDGERISVDGKAYYARRCETLGNNKIYVGYMLQFIGAEEGTYTYNDKTIELDGVGNVTGIKGEYWVYDNTVVVMFEDYTFIGFDYEAAKAANGTISVIAPSKHQGIWYQDKYIEVLDENGYKTDEKELKTAYYIFMLDGYGHSRIMYWQSYEKRYRPNWGGSNGWIDIQETESGVHVKYNSSQIADLVFYYNDSLVYTKSDTWILKECSFYRPGYTGSLNPPALPSSVEGSYTGVESDNTAVVLNIRTDLSGSYKGVPFSAIYDGNNEVTFTLDGVRYVFDIVAKTISYGNENVALTRTGDVTEVIPKAFCGVWSGTWTVANGSTGNPVKITLEADGTFRFGNDSDPVLATASYDAATNTITASATKNDTPYNFTLTYNPDTKELKGRYTTEYDGNAMVYECPLLTKVTE